MKRIIITLLLTFVFSVTTSAQGFFEHRVKAGESIASIVQKYEVSPYEIYQLNPDAKQGVTTGMVLVLLKNNNYPFDARLVDLKKHKVTKNEKIEDVAKANHIDVATLKKYNPKLYAKPLRKGCKLKIPVFSDDVIVSLTSVPNVVAEQTVSITTNTISHKVQPKETKYGIAKQYDLTISELERFNPQIKEGLKDGQVLTIQKTIKTVVIKENDAIVEDQYAYYTVKPREGFYRLTKTLGISKEELLALNPSLEAGVKEGMILKYPKVKAEISDKVRYNLLDSITNYKTQNVTFLLPLRLHKIVATDSASPNFKKIIKKDKVMNIALDYYTGAQMAIDSLKQLGVHANVRVVDTQYDRNKKANAKRIAQIVASNYQEDEIVFGPIVPSNIISVAKGLSDKKVSIFVPFAMKEAYVADSFHETSASNSVQREKMIAYLEEDVKDKQVIIIADATALAVKNKLIAKFPQAKIIVPREDKNGLLIPSDFNNILQKDKENLVILETKKVGLIATVVSILDTKLEGYKIKLVTTSSQKQFENKGIANRYKTKLNYHFPSVYKTKAFKDDDAFLTKYKQTYGKFPNRYAIRGFDLTFDTLLRQANKETMQEGVANIGETIYLENKFDYKQNTAGGFANTAIYILHYTPDFKIEDVLLEKESVLVVPEEVNPVFAPK